MLRRHGEGEAQFESTEGHQDSLDAARSCLARLIMHLAEGAERACKRADVGVVDVAVDHVGDRIAARPRAHRVCAQHQPVCNRSQHTDPPQACVLSSPRPWHAPAAEQTASKSAPRASNSRTISGWLSSWPRSITAASSRPTSGSAGGRAAPTSSPSSPIATAQLPAAGRSGGCAGAMPGLWLGLCRSAARARGMLLACAVPGLPARPCSGRCAGSQLGLGLGCNLAAAACAAGTRCAATAAGDACQSLFATPEFPPSPSPLKPPMRLKPALPKLTLCTSALLAAALRLPLCPAGAGAPCLARPGAGPSATPWLTLRAAPPTLSLCPAAATAVCCARAVTESAPAKPGLQFEPRARPCESARRRVAAATLARPPLPSSQRPGSATYSGYTASLCTAGDTYILHHAS